MKLNYWLIILLVLLSPSQLGLHFWPEWSFVDGIKIDYLSPTIYLTDLLLGGLFIITAIKFRNSKFLKVLGAVFLGLVLLSGKGNPSSAYWSLRYLQIPILAWLIYVNGQKTVVIAGIRRCLSLPLLFTLVLELCQFTLKRSTELWWIFGERSFSLATPNIATIDILGQRFLRPYATFSHPNALAGWLLLAMFIIWDSKFKRLLALGGILLTFSRNAIFASAAGVLFYSTLSNQNHFQSLITFSSSSFSDRNTLNQIATNIFFANPIFGIGPGKFISALPDYFPPGFWNLQPPHNVFFLILAETGIFGILILGLCLFKIYPLLKSSKQFYPGAMAKI